MTQALKLATACVAGISAVDATIDDLSALTFAAFGEDAGFAGYSIDNVEVIPEPTAPVLLLMSTGLLWPRKRRS